MNPPLFFHLILAAAWLGSGFAALRAEEARDRAVEIRAVIRTAPPRIQLFWNPASTSPLLEQKIYRRLEGDPIWLDLARPPLTATTYADNAVAAGFRYEYFIRRIYQGESATTAGWLSAGLRAPVIAERGKVILLVDDTMAGPLATELTQFTSDLLGDGWQVVRQEVSRTASVPSVRAVVQALAGAAPSSASALILFGHLPVPYSGSVAPDGHVEHLGAWPADVYYGDLDGTWTDSTVNESRATQPRHRNVPGDGKFDQSTLPSDVDLAVGRIDLAAMPNFGVSETDLLRQYLARDHQYRHRLGAFASIPRRALIDDHFGLSTGEPFAATGWRSFSALFGSANVHALDWFSTLPTQKYLCAYGCGAGSYLGASGVGTTSSFAANNSQAVFNFLFGSYFGDWDIQNSFLRAPLAGTPGSFGLASCWAGRPHWFLHSMGLGATIGACARLAQNNLTSFPGGYDGNNDQRGIHIALLGDPTLRLHPVKPPTTLVARPSPTGITLSWRAGGDFPVEGYVISRATSPLGPFVRLRGAAVPTLTFIDRAAPPGESYTYLVRAVKRETTTSGSYLNPSQGSFSAPVVALAASGPEIHVEGRSLAISDGDTGPLEANDTSFGNVEIGQPPVTHTFTVRNFGTTPLIISSTPLVGPQAADFRIVPPPRTIEAGGFATFTVSFQPTAIGLRVARMTLRSNDINEAVFDFAIAGRGLAAPLP